VETEDTNSAKLEVEFDCGESLTRPAKLERLTKVKCEVTAADVWRFNRRLPTPRYYAQALAAGECGPASFRDLKYYHPWEDSFGTYIHAGHVVANSMGGVGGTNFVQVLGNFIPQSARVNTGGATPFRETAEYDDGTIIKWPRPDNLGGIHPKIRAWRNLEKCIILCLKHAKDVTRGTLEWTLDYPSEPLLLKAVPAGDNLHVLPPSSERLSIRSIAQGAALEALLGCDCRVYG
jgi:hypothetical protein